MERAEALHELRCFIGQLTEGCRKALETLIPELKESEDEKIRKLLIWQVHLNIEDETNDLAQSVYDGIKGHDPDLEESIEDWKKCLAWLEKQKEQKPVEPSDEELQRHQDELYDFKVFAAKQVKEHHISFVHDFEWNNFCEELLSYFNEKQKPAEWSEEDEKKIYFLSRLIEFQVKNDEYCFSEGRIVSKQEAIEMLKSLRPRSSWRPSEEQMEALMLAIEGKCAPTSYMSRRLEDLYEALVNEFYVECKLDK